MAIGMSELKKGLKIEVEGIPYKIVEYQHVKPGKGAAFVRAKIKSFLNGKTIEKTFHAGDKCETPNLQQKQMQFLYDDGELLQFMDTATYVITVIMLLEWIYPFVWLDNRWNASRYDVFQWKSYYSWASNGCWA